MFFARCGSGSIHVRVEGKERKDVQVGDLKRVLEGSRRLERLFDGPVSANRISILRHKGGAALPDHARVYPFASGVGEVFFEVSEDKAPPAQGLSVVPKSVEGGVGVVTKKKALTEEEKRARFEMRRRQMKERQEVGKQLLSVSDEGRKLLMAGEQGFASNEFGQALESFRRLEELSRDGRERSKGGLRRAHLAFESLALRGQGRVRLAQKRGKEAVELLERARSSTGDESVGCLMELGEALLLCGESKKAFKVFQDASERLASQKQEYARLSKGGGTPLAKAQALGDEKWSVGARAEHDRRIVQERIKSKPVLGLARCADRQALEFQREDVICACVRALNQSGNVPAAMHVLNSVVDTGGSHPGVLLEYASFQLAQKDFKGATLTLFNALILRDSDPEIVQRLAAMLCAREDAVDDIVGALTSAKPQALAYLADTVRDGGAIEACVALLEEALHRQKDGANFALSLAHALENLGEVSEAIECIKDFCAANPDLTLASDPPRSSVRLEQVAQALAPLPADLWAFQRHCNLPSPSLAVGEAASFAAMLGVRSSFRERHSRADDIAKEEEESPSGPSASLWAKTPDGKRALLRTRLFPPSSTAASASSPPPPPPSHTYSLRWIQSPPPAHMEVVRSDASASVFPEIAAGVARSVDSPQGHEIFALVATAVKVLFVTGATSAIPPLLALLEPVRAGVPLHQTKVRNEAAFYTLVSQILATHQLPPADPALYSNLGPSLTLTTPSSPKPIYVLGDSHVLPLAWHTVNLKTSEEEEGTLSRLLLPALVTGIKIFHLRDESTFYTRSNFDVVAGRIPPESDVIVCMGELDCREGIPTAMAKQLYKSPAAAIKVLVKIYLDTLQSLAETRRHRFFLHPVPPVLHPTRSIVVAFNKILRRSVESLSSPFIHYLDIENDLHGPGGETAVNPEYAFDETHLHPKYLQTIVPQLRKLMH